jgi:hypothetical protein
VPGKYEEMGTMFTIFFCVKLDSYYLQVEIFWAVMLCSVVVEYSTFRMRCPEDGESKVLQNVGKLPQHYLASQPTR